jgi:outer membrane protein
LRCRPSSLYDASKQAQAVQLREKAAGADVQFAAEQQQLILRVGQAYFKLLAAQDRLASYQAQVAASEQQRRGAQARFDAGRARITDVREAEARRDASEAQRIGAEADLAYARADFAELTGLPTEGLKRPADGFQAPPPPAGLEECIEQAERRSPLVQAAVHQARAAGAEIDRYGLAGRPVVEGVAGYQGQYRLGGDSGNGIVPDRLQSASAGLRITIPLYAGGAIASKEREARANASKAAHDLDGARRDARLQAQQAWYGVSTGARRVAALDTAQRSAGLQQVASNTGREVGIRTQDDVLNAQAQSFSTDRDRRQAIYDYLTARLQLAAATGDLNSEALAGVNAMLQ